MTSGKVEVDIKVRPRGVGGTRLTSHIVWIESSTPTAKPRRSAVFTGSLDKCVEFIDALTDRLDLAILVGPEKEGAQH
jgi:hypothetical protein